MIASKYICAVILTFLITLPACSNTKEPKTESFFHTQIREDNSKEFIFSLIFSRNEKEVAKERQGSSPTQKRGRGNGSGKGQGKGNKSQNASATAMSNAIISHKTDKMLGIFQQHLDLKMQESTYCRTGYLTLEKSFVGAVYTLRGECNESATEEDRKLERSKTR